MAKAKVLAVRGELEMLPVGTVKPNDMTSQCRIHNTLTGETSDPIPLQVALKWGYWVEPTGKEGEKETTTAQKARGRGEGSSGTTTGLDDKARGRGGTYGRWRTLKDGRRVFVSGGLPGGNKAPSLFVNRGGKDPPAGTHIFARTGAYGHGEEIDPDQFSRFLHDFEEMPSWATRDIKSIELHTEQGPNFTAGGQEFETAMDYTHGMGRVRVFDANDVMRADRVNTGLYHEVGHNLEYRWADAGVKQSAQALREHGDWFQANGDLKREYQQDYVQTYPFGSAWDRFHSAWRAGEDGITNYSRAWAQDGNYRETVAEFSRFYFLSGRAGVMKVARDAGAFNLGVAFLDAMTAFSKRQDRKGLDEKARGRGATDRRWRTLKDGRSVFVTGGIPSGSLVMARQEGEE